jgi:hypothetical protein
MGHFLSLFFSNNKISPHERVIKQRGEWFSPPWMDIFKKKKEENRKEVPWVW